VLPCPDLCQEGHGGLEDVGAPGKQGLQLLKVCELTLRIKPAVSQASAHQGPVLALHVTVVVLVVGTGMGERDTSGMTESVETIHVPFLCQESEGGGRTHLEEKLPCLVLHMEMPMCGEVLHEEWHASCQTDRSQERACAPDRDQCLLHRRVIQGRTMLV
jgi:hypothetical protein